MADNNMMDQDESGAAGIADSEGDIVDDVTDFIDMNDAVEIQVDDDLPMEDDDGNGMVDEPSDENADGDNGVEETVADMSNFQLRSHTDSVYSVSSFVENGELSILSGGGDDKAFLYKISAANGERSTAVTPLSHPHTDTVSSVAYNIQYVGNDPKKTPRLAAVGSYDGTIVIYDADTGTQKLKLEGPSDVEWMSFHPKGGTVLLTGSGDGTLWMFHIPLNRCLQVFVGHEQAVTAGCFSPDGKWALSASSDGTLRIWAPKTGLNKHVFRLGEAGLTCMANNGGSDGMLVIAGSEDGQAHVCHIGSKKVVASLRHYEAPTNEKVDEEDEMEYPMSVEAVGFSPSQPNWCATGGVDGKLKIWDLARDGQMRQVCTPSDTESTDSVTRISWHPTLPFVFAATINGTVRVWDARNGTLLHTLTGGSTADQINDMNIQFLSDGSAVIVAAGDDNAVRVFELDVKALTQARPAADSAMQS
jgi:ribosome assembly protein SQT1